MVEPAELAVSREYEIPWKKQTFDVAELARLRFEEKLGSRADRREDGNSPDHGDYSRSPPGEGKGVQMTSFIKWMIGVAIGVAISGHLKSATLKMAQRAATAQEHQISYGKFSRMLTAPTHPKHLKK